MTSSRRLLRRLRRTAIQGVPTIAIIVIANFFLLQLAPGDAADFMALEAGAATEEGMAALRQRFGLDLTPVQQFLAYIGQLAQFSLGFSPRYNMPIGDLIMERLPGTLILMGSAFFLAIVLGLTLGSLMAAFAGTLPDRLLSVLTLLFYSVPAFWVGLMLVVLFSVTLGWLPSGGAGTIGGQLTGMGWLIDRLRHLILPTLSLALFFVAIYARLTRAAVLEVRSQDYVRTAAAKGLSPFTIGTRHVLRNALLPVTTLAGVHLGGMLGGAVVVETVYGWPGLGRLAYEAVMARDFNILLGVLLLSACLVIIINALVDIIQTWLDPRIGIDA